MAKTNSTGFKEILSELRKNEIRDLYVLEGEDIYLKNKIAEALEKLLIEHTTRELDRVVIDAGGKTTDKIMLNICDELSSPPFMSKRKLIIIRNSRTFSESPAAETVNISNVLGKVNNSSCLVFFEEKVDKRKKTLLKEILNKGVIAEIVKAEPAELRTWTIKEFARNGIRISPMIADSFVERNDRDMLIMENEAQKLRLYVESQGSTEIVEEHLEMIGTADLKGSIFDMMDMISSGNASSALSLLDSLISRKEPVQLIFFMLARHIKQLICAGAIGNASRAASEMKVPPFVASKLVQTASAMSSQFLVDMYIECAETDISIKTSKIQDRTGLEMLISSFANRSRS